MKEIEFIEIIKNTLADSSYIGDDCAFLNELGLFVTQDTLVEDVHFSLKYAPAEQIGFKAVVVNLSDLASSLAKPLYLTVSLSLPSKTDNVFVSKLYSGINMACNKYNVKVVGGDLTGSEKIVISICAIGKKQCDFLAQRNNAKVGDIIFTTGTHGSSGAGLKCLEKNINNSFLITKHLCPAARFDASDKIVLAIKDNICCMDTSDGLFDAIYKICNASNLTAKIDLNKIPYDKEIEIFPKEKNNLILFGGEDYELVGTCDKETFEKLDKNIFFKIGKIVEKKDLPVVISGVDCSFLSFENTFNHFK